jgi:hypothetical protein
LWRLAEMDAGRPPGKGQARAEMHCFIAWRIIDQLAALSLPRLSLWKSFIFTLSLNLVSVFGRCKSDYCYGCFYKDISCSTPMVRR